MDGDSGELTETEDVIGSGKSKSEIESGTTLTDC